MLSFWKVTLSRKLLTSRKKEIKLNMIENESNRKNYDLDEITKYHC